MTTKVDNKFKLEMAAARKWISEASKVLIVAGAGMSAYDAKTHPGMNVYVNPDDFKKHYSGLLKYGFRTGYECMGLFGSRVPEEAIYGYLFSHIRNMRYKFPPNPGYKSLFSLLKDKDYFVVTSNVDGCFERAGFDHDRIYTPQGDWRYLQCRTPCHRTVYNSPDYVDKVISHIKNGVFEDKKMIPECPRCGGRLMGNVRGGGWFIHDHYKKYQKRAIDWVNAAKASGQKVAVIEIGAGFNTPVVTRFPAESIARDLGSKKAENSAFIRINPSDPQIPMDLPRAVGIPSGWQVLHELSLPDQKESSKAKEEEAVAEKLIAERAARISAELKKRGRPEQWERFREHVGHFDWEKFWKALD